MAIADKSKAKVLATKMLLLDILNNPTEFSADSVLIKKLRSQGGIAKMEILDRGIASCSLNTLKTASEALLDRGFHELDQLRINAIHALQKSLSDTKNKPKGNTKENLTKKCNKLQEEINLLHQSIFLLQTIVSELRFTSKQIADEISSEERHILYKELNNKLEAKLSFTLNGEL